MNELLKFSNFDRTVRKSHVWGPQYSLLRLTSRATIIQAVQVMTDPCQYILNTCTVLNCVTMLKFDMHAFDNIHKNIYYRK